MGKKKNKKPTGLKITRNGESFTFSWNNGGSYNALQLQYAIMYSGSKGYSAWAPKNGKSFANHKTKKWSKKFSGSSTSKYTAIKFRVRGRTKEGKKQVWHGWVTSAAFDIKPPKKPSFSLTFNNDYNDPAITLSWTATKSNTAKEWFYAVGWKTRLTNNVTGKVYNWSSITYDTSTSKSVLIREDPNYVFKPGSSWKREVALIAFGPGGCNPTTYASNLKSYVYAKPNTPVICDEDGIGAQLKDNTAGTGYICDIGWLSNRSPKHPVDSEEIQYLITAPAYDSTGNKITIPTGQLSWSTAGVYHGGNGNVTGTRVRTTKKKNKKKRFTKVKAANTVKKAVPSEQIYFEIDQLLPNDNVVFARIVNKRATSTLDTPSAPVLCEYDYDIAPPTGVQITLAPSGTNNKISVSATNNCQIEGSYLAVSYYPPSFNKTLDTKVNPDKVYYIQNADGNYERVTNPKDSEVTELYYEYTPAGNDEKNTINIGYILPSEASPKVIEIPNNADTFSIGVCALVGKIPTPIRNTELEYNSYDFSQNALLESDTVWVEGQTMPKPPTNIRLEKVTDTSIHVAWDWDWKEADAADISWSDDPNAWESTSEPSTYRIDNLVDGSWYIAGLSTGNDYFVRVRLVKKGEGDIEYVSRWSDNSNHLFLSTQPLTPVLEVSPSFINPGGTFTATWAYVTNDNTAQADATVRLDGTAQVPTVSAGSRQSIEIDTSEYDWEAGTEKLISVQVRSELGVLSEWSETVNLPIVAPLNCSLTLVTGEDAGFASVTETYDVEDDDGSTYEDVMVYYSLQKYPFDIQVSGSGEGGTVRVYIERWGRYLQPGPDENDFVGYDNEIVYSRTIENVASDENVITVNRGDLVGSLDDGGTYVVRAEVEDTYGQIATNSMSFAVDWEHKAYEPSATITYIQKELFDEATDVTADNYDQKKYELYIRLNDQYVSAENTPYDSSTTYYYKDLDEPVAKIQSYAVPEAVEGDVLDIYRLSLDKPELIYQGGAFDAAYIDPYPTIGEYGGYRVVFRTKYDDYIQANGEGRSWVDYSPSSDNAPAYKPGYAIINFDSEEVHLEYNVTLSNAWNKDFTETKYLGGSIQGDWNPAVSRTGSINTTVVTDDVETIRALRRLAVHAGPCHVRTLDGSNYEANVTVNENIPYQEYFNSLGDIVKQISYDLNVTRIDNDSMDGILYSVWENE